MENDFPEQLPNVKINDFEGPLDLLLHLIKQAKMDIYDIQISEITAQYLAYLHVNQQLKLDIAGEYLIMAATLMRIKSKLLLPNEPSTDDDIDEEEDPRQDLVSQLVEYQKYQQAAKELHTREDKRHHYFTREEASVPEGMQLAHLAPGLTVQALKQAFEHVLIKHEQSQPIHRTIAEDSISVTERIHMIKNSLIKHPQGITFDSLFENHVSSTNLVVTFMAMLELVKKQQISFQQPTQLGTIKLFNPGDKANDQ
ncbi:Segregation and condensation protein A [Pediococcus damnosus]|uniref:Segregation and condensation protein A n=1 Tax=Pediococcus damnosus TaxID=51663 RepID=A0A0R2HMP6_9LACO|nr:segregation/condensation protein A [Pediococcus damnosus]AMV61564.1 Segregation and condensation protein A [Pediococcus damnosus]AMV62072.1 Segregation and condensation protein A [Pediococcus damnosus]AMV65926.1 Segregation and condensation protein A [Pediococcus damnosus]AMV68077.1 Segregation and condensation protein A [Pediococcus damnosus]KJU74688.1 segregation and condensation protein A [Pediococcus damnosus LMG 28219]